MTSLWPSVAEASTPMIGNHPCPDLSLASVIDARPYGAERKIGWSSTVKA